MKIIVKSLGPEKSRLLGTDDNQALNLEEAVNIINPKTINLLSTPLPMMEEDPVSPSGS